MAVLFHPFVILFGVEFEDVIGWKFQVDLIARKVSMKIGMLRRYGKYLTDHARSTFYKSVIEPRTLITALSPGQMVLEAFLIV